METRGGGWTKREADEADEADGDVRGDAAAACVETRRWRVDEAGG